MQACLFLAGARPLANVHALRRHAADIHGLRQLIVHESMDRAVDPRIAAPSDAPSWVLQWYFDELAPVEAALRAEGPIGRALDAAHDMRAEGITQQVMAVRTLRPAAFTPAKEHDERCTYLVEYEGPAEDLNAWLAHYLLHHPPLMLQLPALRELEIYTRMDCTSGLRYAHATAMQRNKVAFDDAGALARALASPVRDAMRRDFHALPPYRGASPHFAMRSTYGNLAAD
ncbi:ethyl tert-butyl ether degradation protein EthD [Caballeronia hypogeia]|nr:ethyl tert-butyl ether degradation protein EthD [Caballeronia hypogeia]